MDTEIIFAVVAALSSFLTGIGVSFLKDRFKNKKKAHEVDISQRGSTITVSLSSDSDSNDVEEKLKEYLKTQQDGAGQRR